MAGAQQDWLFLQKPSIIQTLLFLVQPTSPGVGRGVVLPRVRKTQSSLWGSRLYSAPERHGRYLQINVQQYRSCGVRPAVNSPFPSAAQAKSTPSLLPLAIFASTLISQSLTTIAASRDHLGQSVDLSSGLFGNCDACAVWRKVPRIVCAGVGAKPGEFTSAAFDRVEDCEDELRAIRIPLGNHAKGRRRPGAARRTGEPSCHRQLRNPRVMGTRMIRAGPEDSPLAPWEEEYK